jgi:hypothetical protein
MAVLNAAARKRLPASKFALSGGRYPIPDISHARNALSRSSGKPEEAAVKAAVYRAYPQLKKQDSVVQAITNRLK